MVDVRTSTRPLSPAEGLSKLAGFPFALLTWVDADGMPMSAAVDAEVDEATTTASFGSPAGLDVPVGATVSLTGSHIRPQPGFGYDERRHVTVWGTAAASGDGRLASCVPSGPGAGTSPRSRSPSTPSGRCASRTPTTTASPRSRASASGHGSASGG